MLFEVAHAKLNLSLLVTGRRADGFHELVSLVALVDCADRLEFTPGGPWKLSADDAALPTDGTNLIIKAAMAFQRRCSAVATGSFVLQKKIPSGAGMGGGSADAAAAIRLLNRTLAKPLSVEALREIAAEVGSDCPYFISGGVAVMRGRGEKIESVSAEAARALAGRRVVIVKPPFGVPTPEAYGLLAHANTYIQNTQAEERLHGWLNQPQADPSEMGNSLQEPVFAKYLAMPVALEEVATATGVVFRMTGSGSACFALCSDDKDVSLITAALRRCWGPGLWVSDSRILG